MDPMRYESTTICYLKLSMLMSLVFGLYTSSYSPSFGLGRACRSSIQMISMGLTYGFMHILDATAQVLFP